MQWEQVSFLVGAVAAWSVLIIGTVKFVIGRSLAHYDEKFRQLDADHADLRKIKAELPQNYMRREDYLRLEMQISTKFERLYDQLEKVGCKSKEEFFRHEAAVIARFDGVSRQIDMIREKLT